MKRSLIQILTLLAMVMLISASDQPPEKKITVAVYQPQIISEDKADNSLSPVLADFLIDELNKSTELKIIEQEMSSEVEKQLDFANSDKCDQTQCHIPVGNLIAAQKLLASKLTRLDKVYVMSVRLIDIKKGVVEFTAKERITGEKDDLEQLTQLVADDVREHFGEKVERPKPLPQAQPQASAPANTPAAPKYPYETLASNNPLGISVEYQPVPGNTGGRGKWLFVTDVDPDSPCKFLKEGYAIFGINPTGEYTKKAPDNVALDDKNIESFKRVVLRIKPGATVGISYNTGGIWGGLNNNVCHIPEEPN